MIADVPPEAGRRNKLLIVNADDLGRTPGINAGVFEAHDQGVLRSATLMVGYPAAVAAARQLPSYPDLGVGLHVALTGGRPILPPDAVPSLVDSDGRLPRYPDDVQHLDPADVLAEVRAQLERFRELTGREPTHLDSHHHSHRLPVVCDALITVAGEAGGLPIRNSGPEVAERLKAAAVATPDTFVESFFGPGASWQHLAEIINGLGPGVTEIMCHPAHVDDELRRGSTYTEERQAELDALTRPEARQILAASGVRLVHFGDSWD